MEFVAILEVICQWAQTNEKGTKYGRAVRKALIRPLVLILVSLSLSRKGWSVKLPEVTRDIIISKRKGIFRWSIKFHESIQGSKKLWYCQKSDNKLNQHVKTFCQWVRLEHCYCWRHGLSQNSSRNCNYYVMYQNVNTPVER